MLRELARIGACPSSMTVMLSSPRPWFHNVASIFKIHTGMESSKGKCIPIANGAIGFDGDEVFGIAAECLEVDNVAWGPALGFWSKNT